MIIVRLCGGLGNQLFQYAAGRALSLKNGTELVLDLSWFRSSPSSNTKREFELGCFDIKASFPTRLQSLFNIVYGSRFFSALIKRIPLPNFYVENGYNFNPQFKSLPKSIYLNGYWQSYLYFDGIKDEIRSNLRLKLPMTLAELDAASKINNSIAVSLHVRRGDYVTNPSASNFHGTCTLDYYASAINFMTKRFPEAHFYVFSDDLEWSRNNLPMSGFNVTYMNQDGLFSASQDLRLMSICQHHIIANSSFSWWGAWLNPNQSKVVIAPKKWFSVKAQPVTLIPRDWILL